MQPYEFINKDWIVSPAARRVYRVSATVSLVFFVACFADLIRGGSPEINPAITRALVLAGVLGYCTTQVAMEYFLFRFDESRALKQVFWFCVMLLPFVGAAFYCLIVYSRSPLFESSGHMAAASGG